MCQTTEMKEQKTIFHFLKYREFLRFYLRELPRSRGALKAWAQHLGVHSTLVSQVMIGKRDFTEEQAYDLSLLLGLNQIEKEYFLELLRLERAGTRSLKQHHEARLQALKQQALKLSERISTDRQLTDQESAQFYSSWIFSAVRLCCSIAQGQTAEEISQKLSLPRTRVLEVLEFLRESGFVHQDRVRYTLGTQYTHLGKDSPFLIRHHSNWRMRALQRSDTLSDQELMYTAPFSISEKDFPILREQLVAAIQEFLKTVKASQGEMVACLNMDLFRVTEGG